MNNTQNKIKPTMFDYFLKCLRGYFDFKGRASRKEFWSFMLFYGLMAIWYVFILSLFIDKMNLCREPFEDLTTIFTFIIILPLLMPLISVSVRRLHDMNKSGLYVILLCFCAIVEFIYFFPIDAIKGYYWYIATFNSAVYTYFIAFIFIRKGNNGMNRYGENEECTMYNVQCTKENLQ